MASATPGPLRYWSGAGIVRTCSPSVIPAPEGRRHLGDRDGDAVIGEAGHDHPRAAGHAAGDAKGQVVRLAAGAGEHHLRQVRRESAEQLLRVVEDDLVHVARMGVQHPRLPRHGRDHVRVAVPDAGDVVVHVEVALARRVEQPDALAAHDVDGLGVEQAVGRAEQRVAPVDHGSFGLRQPGRLVRDVGIHHAGTVLRLGHRTPAPVVTARRPGAAPRCRPRAAGHPASAAHAPPAHGCAGCMPRCPDSAGPAIP